MKTKQQIPACAGCAHWRPVESSRESDPKIGQCRRLPPVVVDMTQRLVANLPQIALRTVYPVTGAENGCGEFKPA